MSFLMMRLPTYTTSFLTAAFQVNQEKMERRTTHIYMAIYSVQIFPGGDRHIKAEFPKCVGNGFGRLPTAF